MNYIALAIRLIQLLRFMSIGEALVADKAVSEIFDVPIPLRSSCISTVQYSRNEERLVVNFTDGTSHTYYDIGLTTFLALLSAESHGGYFNEHIRD